MTGQTMCITSTSIPTSPTAVGISYRCERMWWPPDGSMKAFKLCCSSQAHDPRAAVWLVSSFNELSDWLTFCLWHKWNFFSIHKLLWCLLLPAVFLDSHSCSTLNAHWLFFIETLLKMHSVFPSDGMCLMAQGKDRTVWSVLLKRSAMLNVW